MTADERLPGAFEGETVSRRRFMTGTAHSAGMIAAASFTLPALGFAIGPIFDRAADTWQEIGPLSRFTESNYTPVVITLVPGIGEAGRSIAYVRRHNAAIDGKVKDRYDRVVAISSRCVHVGCPVRWVPTSETFICPCHGGVYDFRGLRIGGPPRGPWTGSTRSFATTRSFWGRASVSTTSSAALPRATRASHSTGSASFCTRHASRRRPRRPGRSPERSAACPPGPKTYHRAPNWFRRWPRVSPGCASPT